MSEWGWALALHRRFEEDAVLAHVVSSPRILLSGGYVCSVMSTLEEQELRRRQRRKQEQSGRINCIDGISRWNHILK